MKNTAKINLTVMLLIAVTVGVLSLFFGGASSDALVYSEGRPWNYPKLIAPFDIPIEYDSVSASRIKDSIDTNFAPIFYEDEAREMKAMENITATLEEISGVSASMKNKILESAQRVFDDGIVDNATRSKINSGAIKNVRVINKQGNEFRAVDAHSLRSTMDAYSYIDSVAGINMSTAASLPISNMTRKRPRRSSRRPTSWHWRLME